jgi:hypothetical protein
MDSFFLWEPVIEYNEKKRSPLPTYLIQELQCGLPFPVKCEIEIVEHSKKLFPTWDLMCAQFYPPINQALDPELVYLYLEKEPQTAHILYALCLYAAESGLHEKALNYYNKFREKILGDESHPVLGAKLQRLNQIISLMNNNPLSLKSLLSDWREENLALLK